MKLIGVKVFSLSFIVYLVLLLTLPCQEAFGYVNRSDELNASAVTICEPVDTQPETDDCSPLCVCGCCGLSTATAGMTDPFSTPSLGAASFSVIPSYRDPYKKTYRDTIWQPPKV